MAKKRANAANLPPTTSSAPPPTSERLHARANAIAHVGTTDGGMSPPSNHRLAHGEQSEPTTSPENQKTRPSSMEPVRADVRTPYLTLSSTEKEVPGAASCSRHLDPLLLAGDGSEPIEERPQVRVRGIQVVVAADDDDVHGRRGRFDTDE